MKSKLTRSFLFYFAAILLFCLFISSITFIVFFDAYRAKSLENELRMIATTTARYLSLEIEHLQQEGLNEQNDLESIKDSSILYLMTETINEKILFIGIHAERAIVFEGTSYTFLPKDEIKNIERVLETFSGDTFVMRYFDKDVSRRIISIGVPVYSASNNNQIIAALVMRSSDISNLEKNELPIILIMLGSSVFALVLATLTSIILSRRMSLPLRRIELITRQLTDGDYQARTKVTQNDEVGSLANHIDILAQRLHQASTESSELEHMRKEFISNISHELRTPVAVICNTAEAIYDGIINDVDKIQQYSEQILNESMRMQRMVDDLFDLSCLQNYGYTIEKKIINLVDIVDDVVCSATSLALPKNIKIKYKKDFEKQDFSGDYDRLHQMIMAVIKNAVKFSSNDHVIKIGLVKEENKVILSITNYGKSIEPKHLPYIFDRFYKTNEEGGGTGLGLPITKAIAERHSIEIAVSSKDQRTTFSFVFPLNSQ